MTTRLPTVPDRLPDLESRHVRIVPAGTSLVRLHDTAGRHPRQHNDLRWFGPLVDRGRFDHHPPGPPVDHYPHHGVVYAAIDQPHLTGPGTAVDAVFSEAVQDATALTVTDGLTLTVFDTSDGLQLLDLGGSWAQQTRVGAHLSTAPHADTQPWARAVRTHYPHLHGLAYPPSTGGRATAVAINESAAGSLHGDIRLSRPVGDPALLPIVGGIALRLGFVIEHAL